MAYGLNRMKSEFEAFLTKPHRRVPRQSLRRYTHFGESFASRDQGSGVDIESITLNQAMNGVIPMHFDAYDDTGRIDIFAGSSSTGKTIAAEVITRSLELDFYRIDFSSVVLK